jgi:hypothetical protein
MIERIQLWMMQNPVCYAVAESVAYAAMVLGITVLPIIGG